jgi:hypothetical protein
MSGGGHFTLNDGTTGDFMFGAAAAKLWARVRSARRNADDHVAEDGPGPDRGTPGTAITKATLLCNK